MALLRCYWMLGSCAIICRELATWQQQNSTQPFSTSEIYSFCLEHNSPNNMSKSPGTKAYTVLKQIFQDNAF